MILSFGCGALWFRASGAVKDRWQTTRWCDGHPLAARKAASMGRDFRGLPCLEQSATSAKLFNRGWNPKNLEICKYRGAGIYFPTNRRPRKLQNSNRNFFQLPDKENYWQHQRTPLQNFFFINACQWPCNSLTYHAWLGPFETMPRSLCKKCSICPKAPERRN